MKTMADPALKLLTFDEYAALEAVSETRSEFHDGRVYAMSGSSNSHATICTNLGGMLYIRLKGGSCRSYISDMAFSPVPGRDSVYPDAMIVCGEPSIYSAGIDFILNPTVVFEVLSPSTEAYDRGKKFDLCAKAESLQEYILISQDQVQADVYTRQREGKWIRSQVSGLEATLRIESVNIEIPLADLYERVEFAPESGDSGANNI